MTTILIGVDGSDGAAQALRWTAELASQLGARVVVVHAYEPLAHLGETKPPIDFAELEARAAGTLAKEWCRPLLDGGVEHESHIMEGLPLEVLLDAAEHHDADLIVVGARGLSTFRGMLLGSTSHKLTHVSKRPVVVVPRHDA